jgi:hypothetical protein
MVDAGLARMVLGGSNQARTKAASLPQWINRQQTQIGALAARFHVDAGRDSVVILRNEELPGPHQLANSVGFYAIALDEKALHREGGVDEPRKSLDVAWFPDTETQGMERGRTHGPI